MNELAKWVWTVIVLLAFCGPAFLAVLALIFIVGAITALVKPEWFCK